MSEPSWHELWEQIRQENPALIEARLAESNPIAYDIAKRMKAHWKTLLKRNRIVKCEGEKPEDSWYLKT